MFLFIVGLPYQTSISSFFLRPLPLALAIVMASFHSPLLAPQNSYNRCFFSKTIYHMIYTVDSLWKLPGYRYNWISNPKSRLFGGKIVLLDAKITGVAEINIPESSNVLSTTFAPDSHLNPLWISPQFYLSSFLHFAFSFNIEIKLLKFTNTKLLNLKRTMFTGIIENFGRSNKIGKKEGKHFIFTLEIKGDPEQK